jgi:hypothetical protein
VKLVSLVQRVPGVLLERQVFLVSQGRMESLAPRVKEDLQENMDLLGLLEYQELLDLQDLLVNLVNWESLALQALLVYLVILEDQENLERRDHLGHQVHRVGLAFLDLQVCQDSQGKEVCLDYLGCLA